MPGYGEQILGNLGQSVKNWNQYAKHQTTLQEVAENLGRNALGIAQNTLVSAMSKGKNPYDFIALAEEMQDSQKLEVIGGYLANVALERLGDSRGGEFAVVSKRARLTIVKEGVTMRTLRKGLPPHGIASDIVGRPLDIGETTEYGVKRLTNAPQVGGELIIGQWQFHDIQGLVDEFDGSPRVELEILAKS